MKYMHICMVTSGRPSDVLYGGEVKFILSLRTWLLNLGYDVTIIGRKLFGITVIRSSESIAVQTGNYMTSPQVVSLPYLIYLICMLINSIILALKIIAINHRSRITLIHAQDTGYGGLSAILSAKIIGVPVIISSHGIRHFTLRRALCGISGKLSLLFDYWLDIITTRSANIIICVNQFIKEYFARLGINKNVLKVIPIGIETSKFSSYENKKELLKKALHIENYFVIGYVGRFSPEKNLLTLLKAFTYASKYNNMKLMLIGAGPLEEELKKFSQDNGIINKIIFTGVRYDIDRFLSTIDVFVLPSYTEGCPTVLLEAMASHKAIIASNIPAIREIIKNGKEALLFNPYDVEQLRKLIIILYNNPELRRELEENAGKKVKQYDVNIIFKNISRLYYDVLKNFKKK